MTIKRYVIDAKDFWPVVQHKAGAYVLLADVIEVVKNTSSRGLCSDSFSTDVREYVVKDDILKALDRNEKVTILYHGKKRGEIVPNGSNKNDKIEEHPFFKMRAGKKSSVSQEMDKLRQGRYNDI